MRGFRFSKFIPPEKTRNPFDDLLKIFLQLIVKTSSNVAETLHWMNELDKQYGLSQDDYGMGDFIEDLKKKGFVEENPVTGSIRITPKSEQTVRKSALEEIFGKLKKAAKGSHKTPYTGIGDETGADRRSYRFGDSFDQIAMTDSIRNAQINQGPGDFILTEDDLEIVENEHKTQTSTALMIDVSHSMILYGEDRITPAKKVAMAMAELITRKYPKDTLDILAFGNDAWPIEIKDLPRRAIPYEYGGRPRIGDGYAAKTQE